VPTQNTQHLIEERLDVSVSTTRPDPPWPSQIQPLRIGFKLFYLRTAEQSEPCIFRRHNGYSLRDKFGSSKTAWCWPAIQEIPDSKHLTVIGKLHFSESPGFCREHVEFVNR
jgi:hypothetical protein